MQCLRRLDLIQKGLKLRGGWLESLRGNAKTTHTEVRQSIPTWLSWSFQKKLKCRKTLLFHKHWKSVKAHYEMQNFVIWRQNKIFPCNYLQMTQKPKLQNTSLISVRIYLLFALLISYLSTLLTWLFLAIEICKVTSNSAGTRLFE